MFQQEMFLKLKGVDYEGKKKGENFKYFTYSNVP